MLLSVRIVWIEKWHTIVAPSYGYLKLLKAARIGKKSNKGSEVKSRGIELGTSRTAVVERPGGETGEVAVSGGSI